MFHRTSHVRLTEALSQVHKVSARELVRIYLVYLLASSQTSHIAYNSTPLKPGMTVSNGEDVYLLV